MARRRVCQMPKPLLDACASYLAQHALHKKTQVKGRAGCMLFGGAGVLCPDESAQQNICSLPPLFSTLNITKLARNCCS